LDCILESNTLYYDEEEHIEKVKIFIKLINGEEDLLYKICSNLNTMHIDYNLKYDKNNLNNYGK